MPPGPEVQVEKQCAQNALGEWLVFNVNASPRIETTTKTTRALACQQ